MELTDIPLRIKYSTKYDRRDIKRNSSTKSTICTSCGNETYEKDNLCVLCKKNITQMHAELIESVAQNKYGIKDKKKNKVRVQVRR